MCLKLEILLEQEKRNRSLLNFHWASREAARIYVGCYFFPAIGQDKLYLQLEEKPNFGSVTVVHIISPYHACSLSEPNHVLVKSK